SPVQPVRITASPVPNSERERAAGGKTIRLNVGRRLTTDASDVGVSVLFDRTNWFIPQYITISGDNDALADGLRSINIQHKAVEGASAADGDPYAGLIIPGVVVAVIDDDATQVVIVPTDGATTVAEGVGATPASDTYYVFLSKKPLADVT